MSCCFGRVPYTGGAGMDRRFSGLHDTPHRAVGTGQRVKSAYPLTPASGNDVTSFAPIFSPILMDFALARDVATPVDLRNRRRTRIRTAKRSHR